MEKKKHTGLFIVIGVLIFLALVVVALVGVLAWKSLTSLQDEKMSSQQSSESKEYVTKDYSPEELEGYHLSDVTNGGETTFIKDGYVFTVPAEYDLTYTDLTGTIVYKDTVFQMKTVIVDTSYEEMMKNPELLTQGSVDAGGTILQDIQETEVDGKKYAYYRADLDGDQLFVVYTAAPDGGKRIAGQIALEQADVSDEDMLKMFASIAGGAVKTDQPDSTLDDIVVQMAAKTQNEIHGEQKEKSSMQFGGATITHKVAEGFWFADSFEGSEYVAERYYSEEPHIDITCYLFEIPWYEGVEGYIEESKHLDDTKTETMKIEGKKVYYIVEQYKNGEKEYQDIYAGFNLDEQQFYVIHAYVSNEDMKLTMDNIRDFLVTN